PKVVSTSRAQVQALSLDEAVMQMDLANQDGLAFHRTDTNEMNVLYRRREDGTLALIATPLSGGGCRLPDTAVRGPATDRGRPLQGTHRRGYGPGSTRDRPGAFERHEDHRFPQPRGRPPGAQRTHQARGAPGAGRDPQED